MKLLENPLVLKYFGCGTESGSCNGPHVCIDMRARRVIEAMEQQIKKGEKFLWSFDDGKTWEEHIVTGAEDDKIFHPFNLRLPDRFQPPVEQKTCCTYSVTNMNNVEPGSVVEICQSCFAHITKPTEKKDCCYIRCGCDRACGECAANLAKQAEKAVLDKTKANEYLLPVPPEEEKCPDSWNLGHDRTDCPRCKPPLPKAVEENIEDVMKFHVCAMGQREYCNLRALLRELVDLARKEK